MTIKTVLNHRVTRWLPAIAWTIFLSILLLQAETQPIIPTGIQPAPPSLKRELMFSSVHLLTFSFTAWIWCFALDIQSETSGKLLVAGCMLVMYGLTVEYLQSSIPGRSAQWWDMIANCIGITIGGIVWLWFKNQQNRGQYTGIPLISG